MKKITQFSLALLMGFQASACGGEGETTITESKQENPTQLAIADPIATPVMEVDNQQSNSCFIQISVQNLASGGAVSLKEVGNNPNMPVITQSSFDASGMAKLEVNVDVARPAQLVLPNGVQLFVVLEQNTEILVSYDQNNMSSINIEGSVASIEVNNLNAMLSQKAGVANQLQQQQMQAKASGNTAALPGLEKQLAAALQDYYNAVEQNIPTLQSPIVKLYALNFINFQNQAKFAEQQLNGLKAFSSHPYYQQVNAQLAAAKSWIGESAPDITLPTPDGNSMSLSSLKGQVVLLDFWASWCGPCRRENPNVVKAYDKYKGKGFTVFSVSLDKRREPWLQAIKADNLKWDSHVSELGGWGTQAIKPYGVNSIPATFLIDKNGIIVAKNLRGPALEQKLAELLD